MNPQYGGPMGARVPFGAPHNQQPQQNNFNGFQVRGGAGNPHMPVAPGTVLGNPHMPAAPGKGYMQPPYGNPGMQNGPSVGFSNFPGQLSNQSTSQVQSAAVPPNELFNNQLSHDMNAMHLSQNQNHPLLTSIPPAPRFSTPEPYPPPSPNQLQQPYRQMQPNMYGVPQATKPPLASYPPVSPNISSSNYQQIQSPDPLRSVAPSQNAGYMQRPYSDRPLHGEQRNEAVSNQIPHRESSPHPNQQFPPAQPPLTMGQNANGSLLMQSNQYGVQNARSHLPSPSPNAVQSNVPPVSQSDPSVNQMGPLTQPPVQNRRLDPDNMPSPIQVIEDDRKLRSNSFVTNQRGQVPPLVTTNFTVYDEGICSPRFIRSTIYNVPTTADVLKQTYVPFAVSISPFARLHDKETPPPISNTGDQGPVRCNRCKAYMCPYMQFIDAGRRFQCVFCKATTEVPPDYFAHLDHQGERVDKFSRPELCLGSYEFIANKDYCKNGKIPNSPAFIFLIDVSYNSIRSGMVHLLCDNMIRILRDLPREANSEKSKVRVGFITYSSVVHFYNIHDNLVQPQMMVVSDVQDMFMPLLNGFLVEMDEEKHVIESLMEKIPRMFAETKETETILGPAIQAGLEALKAADCAGKLFIFHSSLPIAEAPGRLRNRDDRKLLGTEKEKSILSPQTPFYNNVGQECVSAGCCVDLFLFNNAYIDIATLSQVCRLTGGQVYKYTYFQADIDGERFIEDFQRDISKPIAFDAVMRVRTSTGIRPTDFVGNFFMSNTTDVELGAVDCDKSIAVEIKYDDKLTEEDGVCIQSAILFTSCEGQRKLRIHNLVLNTCTQMSELFRNCELDTMMNVFLKEAVRMIGDSSPRQVKEHFISRSAQILACYRKHCAQASSVGQLILPECMKLMPLYINCLIKCDAIAGGQEMTTDDRSFIMSAVYSMDVDASAAYLYPRLLPVHDISHHQHELPVALRCSIERLKEYGIYLLENGLNLFLWVGMNANQDWIQDVFGVPTVARIDTDKTQLLQLSTELSERMRAVIEEVRSERQRYMKLYVVRQGDKLELLFRQLLVEDRTTEGSVAYVDFLCHLHKEIRDLLS